ncbi:hypothetical protein BOTBODRAFT_137541 [Botryobasidium botryosum FD-172 SS1]|uniref:Extracellular metalloproteinase n=1 Tax=Botryobasidium botryosum (strain FD-172 SS1) TaxID=930990 RepID=A0A067MCZ5_BOTB1|nr:hypothetical protein BOTBODRAFT_137541 [Botryobasidium botryosum FD-172 SS1]
MRSLYGIAFALAATSALARSQHSAARTRKSLSFGPDIPHASFTVAPQRYTSFTGGHSRSPYDVAREYVNNVLARGVPNGLQFIVRDDSYTDDATGVTHVYVRQLVNGLEVADGDINLNIFKGQVISLGDSFYRGPTPEFDGHPTSHSIDQHTEFCERLATRQRVAQSSQVVLDNQAQPYAWDEDHESLSTNYGINCNTHPLRQQSTTLAHPDIPEPDPRRAALLFMIAAHPDHGVAESLLSNLNAEVEKISVAYETHFVGEHAQPMAILSNVPGTVNPVKARLAYVQSPESEGSQKTVLHLVHKLEVEMKDNWYEAAVDAKNPTIIRSVVDWASDSPVPTHVESDSKPKGTYKVWKFGINDPSEGERSIEVGPYDKWASPLGWHSIPAAVDPSLKGHSGHLRDEIVNHTTTFGNNVFAHEDWEGANNWLNNYRPDGGENLEFVYKYFPKGDEPESDIKPKSYINLTVTQLFYTTNMVHDLYHRYGFDEKSGNFQQDNFGRGGRDGDAVIANAQDGSGYNNANFMTPPDGQNGRCRMYIWNTASPFRDGDLEAGIVIHELSHGLSTRLTGGPLNSGCLGWGESGGMGEGWGDFLATTIRSTKNYSDYAMGSWAANQEGGIRNFIYSTDLAVNPSTYKTLDKPGYWGVHAIGEVWAQILWVVSQKLIEKHGYSDTLFPPQRLENGTIPLGDFYREPTYEGAPLVPKHGNTLMVQLVINAMKLQPCRPSFFDARDAIIQADDILTGGENACELWSGFSSRGLGPDATLVGSTPWGGGIRKDVSPLISLFHKAYFD